MVDGVSGTHATIDRFLVPGVPRAQTPSCRRARVREIYSALVSTAIPFDVPCTRRCNAPYLSASLSFTVQFYDDDEDINDE